MRRASHSRSQAMRCIHKACLWIGISPSPLQLSLKVPSRTDLVSRVDEGQQMSLLHHFQNALPLVRGGVYPSGVVRTGMKQHNGAHWCTVQIVQHALQQPGDITARTCCRPCMLDALMLHCSLATISVSCAAIFQHPPESWTLTTIKCRMLESLLRI